MNDMPTDWSEQLQAAYPRRSGPSGWRSSKLMYALRSALRHSTWQEIIDGCNNYKRFCELAGNEGTVYVQSPQRFIEEGSYLEDFGFQAPQSKEDKVKADRQAKDAARWAKARAAAQSLRDPIEPHHLESVEAFETRIRFATTRAGDRASVDHHSRPGEVSSRIASLANRLRRA